MLRAEVLQKGIHIYLKVYSVVFLISSVIVGVFAIGGYIFIAAFGINQSGILASATSATVLVFRSGILLIWYRVAKSLMKIFKGKDAFEKTGLEIADLLMLSFALELVKNFISFYLGSAPEVIWRDISFPDSSGRTPYYFFRVFEYVLKQIVLWESYLFPIVSGVAALILGLVLRLWITMRIK